MATSQGNSSEKFWKGKVKEISKKAFDAVDSDHSGFIELSELIKEVNKVAKDMQMDPPPSEKVLEEIIDELDDNKDKKLSLDEFQILIEQVLFLGRSMNFQGKKN